MIVYGRSMALSFCNYRFPYEGYTPLGMAVNQDGRVDELRSLIEAGCDVIAPADLASRTPLQVCANH